MKISLIAAVAANGVIGSDGDLPWRLADDMAFFKQTTTGHCVLMGRKNYESIPKKFRPLPNRTNIVVTRNTNYSDDADITICHSLEAGIQHAKDVGESELFIIGGGQIYTQALQFADTIYLTQVDAEVEGDTYFPTVKKGQWKVKTLREIKADAKNDYDCTIYAYEKA